MTLFGGPRTVALAPRFVPGAPKSIDPYTWSHYSWDLDIPFVNGKMWIWGVRISTNFHTYLYDLDHEAVLGELDHATFEKVPFDGRPQGWWDEHNILFKDHPVVRVQISRRRGRGVSTGGMPTRKG